MNMHATDPAVFDARKLRDVPGSFATGVTVITICDNVGLVFFRGQFVALGNAL